jgi:TonB family protein
MSSLDVRHKPGGSALLFALSLVAFGAVAQSTPTEDSAAALERKQREAVNPMRMIIEASKLKPRSRPPAAASGPPRTAPSAASPREPSADTSAPRTDDTPEPHPGRAPSDAASPVVAAPPVPVPEAIGQGATSATPVGGNSPAPVTRTEASAELAAPRPATPPSAPSAQVLATARSPSPKPAPESASASKPGRPTDPRQITYQPPDVPASVIARLDHDTEVQIRYVIERSGATSGAEVLGRPSRGLDRPALEAVRQWRFEPMDEPVTRVVRIVFKAPTD